MATQSTKSKIDYSEIRTKVLKFCKKPKSAGDIMKYTGIKTKSVLSRKIINPLTIEGKLDYTNKNSINARNQKYIALKNK